jgi:hypothetical protein
MLWSEGTYEEERVCKERVYEDECPKWAGEFQEAGDNSHSDAGIVALMSVITELGNILQ